MFGPIYFKIDAGKLKWIAKFRCPYVSEEMWLSCADGHCSVRELHVYSVSDGSWYNTIEEATRTYTGTIAEQMQSLHEGIKAAADEFREYIINNT